MLVRNGGDHRYQDGEHILPVVCREMVLQISRLYSSLPDVRALKYREIKFFYEGIRAELIENTKPRK